MNKLKLIISAIALSAACSTGGATPYPNCCRVICPQILYGAAGCATFGGGCGCIGGLLGGAVCGAQVGAPVTAAVTAALCGAYGCCAGQECAERDIAEARHEARRVPGYSRHTPAQPQASAPAPQVMGAPVQPASQQPEEEPETSSAPAQVEMPSASAAASSSSATASVAPAQVEMNGACPAEITPGATLLGRPADQDKTADQKKGVATTQI